MTSGRARQAARAMPLALLLILAGMLGMAPARADSPPSPGGRAPAAAAPVAASPAPRESGIPPRAASPAPRESGIPPRAASPAPRESGTPPRAASPAPEDKTPPSPAGPAGPARDDQASPPETSPKRTIDLMKHVESPITTIASSVQWNAYFDLDKRTPGALTMIGLVPQDLGDLHVIHRATLGMPYVPLALLAAPGRPPAPGPEFGLGDLNYTTYFVPHVPGRFVWGGGTSVTLPTATGRVLGTGKFLAGPSAVAVLYTRNMTIGVLVTQQWSVAGDAKRSDVSAATIQPAFYYNFPSRWYILSTPRLYVNWNATRGPKWSLPVGLGVGRFFRIGKQAANLSLQGFYHLERPVGALWSMNLQFQLLFPAQKPALSE